MKNANNLDAKVDAVERTNSLAMELLQKERVAIFIVAYNASQHIENVFKRIPQFVLENLAQIYLIDDSSKDNTVDVSSQINWPSQNAPLKIFRTPVNQGYGGNQKIGYSYAIAQNFDIVVLLHGDGQYAPEALPLLLAAYSDGADAVFGSRFIDAFGAIRGGMPLYKFVGNRVLTSLQNYFMKSSLSEWHSGYRSYRTRILKKIPFTCNSSDFDFDSEIIIQVLGSGGKIIEVPIPTFYGNEICHVNGLQYAAQCMKNVMQYRAMEFELFYDPRFDLKNSAADSESYLDIKDYVSAKTSLPHYMEKLSFSQNAEILSLSNKKLGKALDKMSYRGAKFALANQVVNSTRPADESPKLDWDCQWSSQFPHTFDIVLALDVIEHLQHPERGILEIKTCMKSGGTLYASTANVAFFPLRVMLLLGFFNYGRKGILDKTHKRLFTIHSFQRLLKQAGFEISTVHGFGPPIANLGNGNSSIIRLLDRIASRLAKWWPSLFAYEFLIVATRTEDIKTLLQKTTDKNYGEAS